MVSRELVANTVGLVAAFAAAFSVAWGANDGAVLFGKRLMSATIVAFVFCSFLEARLSAKAPKQEAEEGFSALRFLFGMICALAVGVLAFSTLSDDFISVRKPVALASAAAISASAICLQVLKGSRLATRRLDVR